MNRTTIQTITQAKRLIKIVFGFTLLVIGIILIVLPGPATVVIPSALAILATEFVWARKLLKKLNGGVKSGLKYILRKK